MYSEQIDNIFGQLTIVGKELECLAGKIIEDIFAVDEDKTKHTINVLYYTDHLVLGWNFLGIDGNGYGSALSIGSIELINGKVWFNMLNEDGDRAEERSFSDFSVSELSWIVEMLNDILTIVKEEGKVNTHMDWVDYLED